MGTAASINNNHGASSRSYIMSKFMKFPIKFQFRVNSSLTTIPDEPSNLAFVPIMSWDYIRASIPMSKFSDRFFQFFDEKDPQACFLLRPHTKSSEAGMTQTSLLERIVEYMLIIEKKREIRALGRRHILSGITREHMESFATVLVMVITSFLDNSFLLHLSSIIEGWTKLLEYFISEMYHEKLNLVTRVSSKGRIGSELHTSTMLAQPSENNDSVMQMEGEAEIVCEERNVKSEVIDKIATPDL